MSRNRKRKAADAPPLAVSCDYCRKPAKLVDGTTIYPHRPDLAEKRFWFCRTCRAWVGCHRGAGGGMTGATLFSGIGAPECAAPWMEWKFCAEIETFPADVHHQRFNGVPNLGDVTAPDFINRARKALDGATLDVLIFGSPCQGFSVAGKRLGLDDPRSNLALHALRICRELAPAWFVFENVPGLFSSWSGGSESPTGMEPGFADGETYVREFLESSDFAEFLLGVQDIGYFGAWRVLDAQYDGVAQRRQRVFFVGCPGDWHYPAAVLLEPESLCGYPPTRDQAGERVAPCLEGRAGRSGETNFATSNGLAESSQRERERRSGVSAHGTARRSEISLSTRGK